MPELETAIEPRSALGPGELQRAVSHGSVWTIIHTVVSVPVAFAANAVIARSLGPASYGELAVLTLIMAVVTTASNLGVGNAVQQWGAAAHARGDHAGVDLLLARSLGFHAMVQVPILLATVAWIGWGQPPLVLLALLIAGLIPPLFGSTSLCISIENRTAQASRLAILTNLLTQGTIATIAVLSRSPVAVWSGRAAIPALMTPMNLALLEPARRRATMRMRLPRGFSRSFWWFSATTCCAAVLGVLVNSRSEILVLQRQVSPEQVGLYALAFGVAAQMRAPVDALLAPLLPGVAGILAAHATMARATLRRALTVSGLIGALLILIVPFVSLIMPVVYGQAFSASAALLPALACAALSQAFANPLIAFVQGGRHGGTLLATNVISLAVDLAVAVALIPVLGVPGAVLATCTAQVTFIGLLCIPLMRKGMLHPRDFVSRGLAMWVAMILLALHAAITRHPMPPIVSGALWSTALLIWALVVRATMSEGARHDLGALADTTPRIARPASAVLLRLLAVPTLAHTVQLSAADKEG